MLSSHDFDTVPADLAARVQAMRSTGAEVVKLAVKTTRLSDCVPLFEIGSQSGRQGRAGVDRDGRAGARDPRARRTLRIDLDMYAGAESGVGQVSVASLLDDYHFRSVTESTDVYGLVGRPVSHSVSPAMHNAAFRAARLDAVYLPFPAADADDFITFARAIGVKGASVTTPYKVALYERIDEAYAVARRIGAINTIRIVDGRWLGGNTDASGFLEPLRGRIALAGIRAAVLGAGGAGRAIAIALASSGADVTVHARDAARAEEVAMLVAGRVGPWPPGAGQLGPAGQLHADRDASPRQRDARPGGQADRPIRVRPRVQPAGDPAAARRVGRGMPDDRRARDARRAGARAVSVVDRKAGLRPASCGRPR